MKQPLDFNWKIAGKAGEGVMVVAKMMAKIAKRHGLNAFNYLEYPSLIKGGHQTGQVYASTGQASCQKRALDVLVTLGPAGFEKHQAEMTHKTIIIYNQDAGQLDKKSQQPLSIFELAFNSLAKEATGSLRSANMAVLGASVYLLGLDHKIAQAVIKDEFRGKSEQVIRDNIDTFDLAYQKAQKFGQSVRQLPITKDKQLELDSS